MFVTSCMVLIKLAVQEAINTFPMLSGLYNCVSRIGDFSLVHTKSYLATIYPSSMVVYDQFDAVHAANDV